MSVFNYCELFCKDLQDRMSVIKFPFKYKANMCLTFKFKLYMLYYIEGVSYADFFFYNNLLFFKYGRTLRIQS